MQSLNTLCLAKKKKKKRCWRWRPWMDMLLPCESHPRVIISNSTGQSRGLGPIQPSCTGREGTSGILGHPKAVSEQLQLLFPLHCQISGSPQQMQKFPSFGGVNINMPCSCSRMGPQLRSVCRLQCRSATQFTWSKDSSCFLGWQPTKKSPGSTALYMTRLLDTVTLILSCLYFSQGALLGSHKRAEGEVVAPNLCTGGKARGAQPHRRCQPQGSPAWCQLAWDQNVGEVSLSHTCRKAESKASVSHLEGQRGSLAGAGLMPRSQLWLTDAEGKNKAGSPPPHPCLFWTAATWLQFVFISFLHSAENSQHRMKCEGVSKPVARSPPGQWHVAPDIAPAKRRREPGLNSPAAVGCQHCPQSPSSAPVPGLTQGNGVTCAAKVWQLMWCTAMPSPHTGLDGLALLQGRDGIWLSPPASATIRCQSLLAPGRHWLCFAQCWMQMEFSS